MITFSSLIPPPPPPPQPELLNLPINKWLVSINTSKTITQLLYWLQNRKLNLTLTNQTVINWDTLIEQPAGHSKWSTTQPGYPVQDYDLGQTLRKRIMWVFIQRITKYSSSAVQDLAATIDDKLLIKIPWIIWIIALDNYSPPHPTHPTTNNITND